MPETARTQRSDETRARTCLGASRLTVLALAVASAWAIPWNNGALDDAVVDGGATLKLTPAMSVYGEVGHLWSVGGDAGVKSAVQSSVGLKVRW